VTGIRTWTATALMLVAATAGAVEISNARLERRSAGDPAQVARSLAGENDVWLAWTVAGTADATRNCCFQRGWSRRGCTLDGHDGGWGSNSDWPPEGGHGDGGELVLLAELDRGRPVMLRAIGGSCPIDGAGRRVIALDGVEPERSLDLLARWARDPDTTQRVLDPVLAGMLGHRSDSVPKRIVGLIEDASLRIHVRKQAIFWLAESGDPAGLAEIEKILSR
jgi:hypothetical protein